MTCRQSTGRISPLTAVGVASVGLSLHSVQAVCDVSLGAPAVSWNAAKNRLTLTTGCATIADLLTLRKDANGVNIGPIQHFDKTTKWYADSWTGTYYLEGDLYVAGGATLKIDGAAEDPGECNTLLMASNSSMFTHVRAHGGTLNINNTRIFSWDLLNADVDRVPEDGRSHLSAVTEKITGRVQDTCPGVDGDVNGRAKNDAGNSRMDIFESEIGYLGYDASESYGISYKARGLCNDHSNLDIYDDDNGLNVGVTGDIMRSNIHHNWFGHYSWAHDGGVWRNNKVHDNYGYGFDPHDDSDNLKIIGNEVYNNGWHGIIASKRCNNVVIRNNIVYNNGRHGIMLHRSCDYGIVRNNNVTNNGLGGVSLFETSHSTVKYNNIVDNYQGVRLSNGANNNSVFSNTIKQSAEDDYAIYTFKGTDSRDAPGNVDGHLKYNTINKNTISSDASQLWNIVNADNNIFRNNVITSGSLAVFDESTENLMITNTFPAGFEILTNRGGCFAAGSQAETAPIC